MAPVDGQTAEHRCRIPVGGKIIFVIMILHFMHNHPIIPLSSVKIMRMEEGLNAGKTVNNH